MSWLRIIEESISEKSKPADSPVPPKKSGWNRIWHLIAEMWPAYLIEILVIILGISITLALEAWREGRKEEKLEKVYLANLSTDIDADLQMLKAAQNATKDILQKGDDLLQFIRDPKQHPLPLSAINSDVRAILGRPKFVTQDATFSDLKSSGNLALLKDIPLEFPAKAQALAAVEESTLETPEPAGSAWLVLHQRADLEKSVAQ